jgi:hypothetical protein
MGSSQRNARYCIPFETRQKEKNRKKKGEYRKKYSIEKSKNISNGSDNSCEPQRYIKRNKKKTLAMNDPQRQIPFPISRNMKKHKRNKTKGEMAKENP